MPREMNGMYQTLCPTLGYRNKHLLTCQGVSLVGLHSSIRSKPDHNTLLPESHRPRHRWEGGRTKTRTMTHLDRNVWSGRCPVPAHQSRDSVMGAGGELTVTRDPLATLVDVVDQLSMLHLMILANGRPQSKRSRCVRPR